ncbi:MAG: dephospho-CoA kinase [Deltaproteobacteria bacterium]|nr:MAG: dephospho-CoA kinase [Deltaproteobacteria bacterium]
MVIAGLTGGIATGKSTVANIMAEAGAHVIDADRIAKDVVKKGLPAWKEITEYFGKEILGSDGEIDRERLGDVVFGSKDKLEVLNKIVHPRVFEEMAREMDEVKQRAPDSIVILDIPLLIETGLHKLLSNVILVYAPERIQLARLMARDNIPKEAALKRIRSQMPIEQKKTFANYIIDNSSEIEHTRIMTLEVLERLKGN